MGLGPGPPRAPTSTAPTTCCSSAPTPGSARARSSSIPDPVGRLAAVEARGGRVVFVDPRHCEPKVGETVQIKPDTDVYLLAAMLHEIDRTVGFDADGAARVRDLDALRAFLARFPPSRSRPWSASTPPTIAAMAREFAERARARRRTARPA